VPPDNLVRQIDGILDLSWVHKELSPYYSHTGRPSIDPVLMIRMLFVGYVFAIRSERRLCSEVGRSTWHTGGFATALVVEDKVGSAEGPIRPRRPVPHRNVLVGGEALSVDASLIKADVDKKGGCEAPLTMWPPDEQAQ
jgi:Transposase domain (DUF772)